MPFEIEKVIPGAVPYLPTLTELRVPGGRGEGELLSAPIAVEPFSRAVLSWNCRGTWRFELRVRIGAEWSPWCVLGQVDGERQSSAKDVSYDRVATATDTLLVKGGRRAQAFQVRAQGAGEIRTLAVTHYRPEDRRPSDTPSRAWGMTLPVPELSQTVEDPKVRGVVCSPTSVAMVLAYYGRPYPTREVARAVWDSTARIYGNWPCNTAAAARLLGGWAAVAKMRGFADVEAEIAARRPLVLSHRWNRGELTGAPVSRSAGHLIVAVGFTDDGDVVVNDPAARPGAVRRVYKRDELFHTWQRRSGGIVYLIRTS